jgi:DNA-binding transcriptional LysR family regulator
MVLTPAGHKLLPEAQKVVAAAQSLRSRARAIQGVVVGRARVGTVSDPDFVRVGDFLSHALEAHPLLEIELHHEVSGAAFEKVRDGTHDASFYYGNLAHPTVTAIPLVDFAFRVVAPADWRNSVADASWDDIVAMPWIMTPPISSMTALAGELFSARGVSPARRIEADNEAVIRSLVMSGLGVALMREDLALDAADAGEVALWEGVRLETRLQFVHLARRKDDPEIRALHDVLHRVWTPAAAMRETA